MIDLFERRGSAGQFPSIADRIDASGDCWEWTGGRDAQGYGRVNHILGNSGLAHRIVYDTLVGIPDGMDLDHLCRVRHCVNPDHLEPTTSAENTRRGFPGPAAYWANRDECTRGHPFDEENTYRYNGYRFCRACRRIHARDARRRRIINDSQIVAP